MEWETRLIHPAARVPAGFRSLVPPIYRASTTVFESTAELSDDWSVERSGYTYGLYGTPTAIELAARVAELEHGTHALVVPGGQAAIALIDLAFLRTGDHVLVTDSIYGPNRELVSRVLHGLGVESTFYPPTIGAGIEALIRQNTTLVWCESPGSVTMEVQDVPAIAEAAHRHGVIVALDNTYAAGVYFDAFAHGVDVTMQALTKYIGGHSDLLLGTVTTQRDELFDRLGAVRQVLGMGVSPDECALALRGMQTLAIRLRALEASTLRVATWLAGRPEIERVLHPALPSCPGHELWRRDFTGSTSVFSVVFDQCYTQDQIRGFVDALQLFEIGWSWGGVTSLAVPQFTIPRTSPEFRRESLVRLNIGLEATEDLLADLAQALDALGAPAS